MERKDDFKDEATKKVAKRINNLTEQATQGEITPSNRNDIFTIALGMVMHAKTTNNFNFTYAYKCRRK